MSGAGTSARLELPAMASVSRPATSSEALNRLIRYSPHCLAMGLRANEASGDTVSLLLEAQPCFRLARGSEFWHPGAIGSACDSVLSMAAISMLHHQSRPATVDLRWDLFQNVPLIDIALTAAAAYRTPEVVMVEGVITSADSETLFGRATICISYASSPGTPVHRVNADTPEPVLSASEFSEWLGLTRESGNAATVPFRPALAGAADYPFWHGGAIAGAMTAAASIKAREELPGARFMTATASFDIFASDRPVQLDALDFRASRTRVSTHVTCSQADRGVTARLSAHFGQVR